MSDEGGLICDVYLEEKKRVITCPTQERNREGTDLGWPLVKRDGGEWVSTKTYLSGLLCTEE